MCRKARLFRLWIRWAGIFTWDSPDADRGLCTSHNSHIPCPSFRANNFPFSSSIFSPAPYSSASISNGSEDTIFQHSTTVRTPITWFEYRFVVAFALGYTATTSPRIASICASYVAKRLKQRSVEGQKNKDDLSTEPEMVRRLIATIKGGLRFDGFAMVCGNPPAPLG